MLGQEADIATGSSGSHPFSSTEDPFLPAATCKSQGKTKPGSPAHPGPVTVARGLGTMFARPGNLVQPEAKGLGSWDCTTPTGRRGEEISLRKEAFFCHLETRGRVSGWITEIENDCRQGEEVYGGI